VNCPGIDALDKCPYDRVIKLNAENEEFEPFLHRILPGLCRPDGSFDYGAITNIFDIYELEGEARQFLFDKCLIMMGVIREMREKQRKQDGR
jgi:hypothetical protein